VDSAAGRKYSCGSGAGKGRQKGTSHDLEGCATFRPDGVARIKSNLVKKEGNAYRGREEGRSLRRRGVNENCE